MDGKSAQMEACGQLGHFGIRSLDLDPSLLRPEGNLSVPVAPSPTSSEPRRREYESMPRSDLPPTLQRECQQLRIIFTLKWTLRLQAKMLTEPKISGLQCFSRGSQRQLREVSCAPIARAITCRRSFPQKLNSAVAVFLSDMPVTIFSNFVSPRLKYFGKKADFPVATSLQHECRT